MNKIKYIIDGAKIYAAEGAPTIDFNFLSGNGFKCINCEYIRDSNMINKATPMYEAVMAQIEKDK